MICEDEVGYDESWRMVSEECRDFVRRLLTKDPVQRLTAAQALSHVWIVGNLRVSSMGASFD